MLKKTPFACLFTQSKILLELSTNTFARANMDAFGYAAAELPALAPPRERYQIERDELREILMVLRQRYGRRRLFRIADVADAIQTVRRMDPRTPVRAEIRRLDWNMRDE